MQLLSFSPNSQQLAATFRDYPEPWDGTNGVIVWDVESGEELWSISTGETLLGEIAYSPDGQRLAAVKNNNGLPGFIIWDAATGEELLNVASDQEAPVYIFYHNIDFSPDGQLLSTSSALTNEFGPDDPTLDISSLLPNQVVVYDAITGEQVTSFIHTEEDEDVNAVAFHPDGQRFATLTHAGNVYVWDIESGERLAAGKTTYDPTWILKFTPDGEQMLIMGEDALSLALLDVETGDEVQKIPGDHLSLSSQMIDFTPDGQRFLSPLSDGEALFIDLGPPRELDNILLVDSGGSRSVFNSDHTLVASVGDVGQVNIRDLATGELLWEGQGHDKWAGGKDFSPNGALLASGSDDGTIAIWDVDTGEMLNKWTASETWVNTLQFSPDGSQLAMADDDGAFKVYEPLSGELILSGKHEGFIMKIDFGPNGELAVPNRGDQTVEIWDPATGELKRVLQSESIGPLRAVFDPDGEWLGANQGSTVEVFDLETGEIMTSIRAHETNMIRFGVNDDGTMLVTSAQDRELRLWDPLSGQLLHSVPLESLGSWFEFSEDNKYLYTTGGAGRMGTYILDPDELADLAEERLTRDFTTAECDRYRIDPCPTEQVSQISD
jgi:WD40 repeat protein